MHKTSEDSSYSDDFNKNFHWIKRNDLCELQVRLYVKFESKRVSDNRHVHAQLLFWKKLHDNLSVGEIATFQSNTEYMLYSKKNSIQSNSLNKLLQWLSFFCQQWCVQKIFWSNNVQ